MNTQKPTPPLGPATSTNGPATAETTQACVQFTLALLRTHQSIPRSPTDPVQRCSCGRALVLCEINSAARDAGLADPIIRAASVISTE